MPDSRVSLGGMRNKTAPTLERTVPEDRRCEHISPIHICKEEPWDRKVAQRKAGWILPGVIMGRSPSGPLLR